MSTPIPSSAQVPSFPEGRAGPSSITFEDVYEHLKALAHRQLSRGARHTLDTTALVHELYLRLDRGRNLEFEHPARYFAYAARAMRNLLINRARDRKRHKAGGASASA